MGVRDAFRLAYVPIENSDAVDGIVRIHVHRMPLSA